MKQQRYVLTIQNASIFREVDVSWQTPELKIGTTQDCGIRMKRELFPVAVAVELTLREDEWRIRCGSGLCFRSETVRDCGETVIRHGDILQLSACGEKDSLLTFSFSYDFTLGEQSYDTIVDIRSLRRFTIGAGSAAQIRLESGFVCGESIELIREANGTLTLDPSGAPSSATLNGVRVFGNAAVREYDFIGIADYSFYFRNQVLYTAGRQDLRFSGVSAQPLREETPAFTYPKLNRSPRMRRVFSRDPIEILSPPKKPEKPRDNLALQLTPALAMMAVTVVTRSGMIAGLQMGNPAFLIFSLSTMAVGLLTTILSFVYNRRRYKQDLTEWRTDYESYIAAKSREIEEEQREEAEALQELYPPAETLRDFVKTFSPRLFERSPWEDDFLHVRAGLGAVPPLRMPEHKREEKIKVENELAELPDALCEKYALVSGVPVMLHLRESGATGVVGTRAEQYDFFKSMLLDVCIQHDYEEVQVMVLIPEGVQALYDWIKWMPHIKKSGKDARGIVCGAESRDSLFEYLYGLMTERVRTCKEEEGTPTPHIVLFALEEYGIRTHPLYQYIDELPKIGISFVFFKEHRENLPQACMEVVELTAEGGVLHRREDKTFACAFTREHVADESIRFAAERLAPVYCDKIALSSRLTANITLFELLNILSPDNLDLNSRWAASNVQRSLAAPIGVDATGGVVCLDLHEKAHGPHGLVAGTTGSGKSEIMQSFILSAAVNFHPYEVAFVIIDFKGGGMANQFERLPHLIGKITDIDSYGINRSLLSIRAELEKRKRLFARQEVNHIDEYIAKYRRGEAGTPLPHLVLIVDEFAELKAEQPDFMKELISTARVGRSLGIHLILATQKPSGQVNEQIWSNSRFKLCLKVATKEDSVEVLRSPLAAEIREPGRAYLQVGNNEIFTLFQSAYSGASASSDQNGSVREFSISEVDFTGRRSVIYQRRAGHSSDGSRITQLKVLVNYVHDYCRRFQIPPLPSICMPPLPETLPYTPEKAAGQKPMEVAVGRCDDPANQIQPEVRLDLAAGNVMVIGSAQSGKTLLLQTILRGIAERSVPGETAVYILDFASKVMKTFEGLNHVGGVLTDADDEKMKSFFKMMREELYGRKELFSQRGISSYEAYLEARTEDLPALSRIIIMVDNLAIFRESFPDHEEAMINLCREGLAVGITVIATAKQTGGLGYKYLNSFSQRLAFNCTESSEYGSLFDRCQIRPQNVQGRGLVSINKVVYEYQAYLPFAGGTESRRMESARAFIAGAAETWGAKRARSIPSIPRVFTSGYWAEQGQQFPDFAVPVGLSYSEIEPVVMDLAHMGSAGILGRKGFGKSNLLGQVLDYLRRHVFDLECEAYLIDSYDHQMEEFRNCGFVEEFTLDCGDFEEIVETFRDAAKERMERLQNGGSLEDEPLMLCVVQNPKIFAPGAVEKKTCDTLRQILGDAAQVKMCFLFSGLENNADYSPPEMVRLSRELAQYILLEDLGSVKLLGANKFTPAELKTYKKPLSLGEGYFYDPRTGVEKIRLSKREGGCEE